MGEGVLGPGGEEAVAGGGEGGLVGEEEAVEGVEEVVSC